MKVLSLVLASGVFTLGVATAQADPAPTPATSGAQTMPSGAEPESPPPATYDPGTPGVAPGTPTSGAAASRAAAAPDTATAPEAPSTATPSGESSTTTTTTVTPPGASNVAVPPAPTPPSAPPPENFDVNTPTPPTTGVPVEKTPNAASTNIDVLPPPPNGQTTESVPVAPLPPMQVAPEGTYPGYRSYSRVGVGLLVGGGFQDFTNNRLKDVTGDGGYWTARVIAGTREYVGMEAAYVGDARSISGLGLGSDSRLISNGLEGNLRVNIPIMRGPSLLEPFGFVGLGWSHYTVSQNNTAVSDFTARDDVLTLPYGGGLEFAYRGFMADARFTYKQTYYNNLTQTIGGNLNNWGVGGQIGFGY
jgi:hypothetical protein